MLLEMNNRAKQHYMKGHQVRPGDTDAKKDKWHQGGVQEEAGVCYTIKQVHPEELFFISVSVLLDQMDIH